jgi:hypothetical protein
MKNENKLTINVNSNHRYKINVNFLQRIANKVGTLRKKNENELEQLYSFFRWHFL